MLEKDKMCLLQDGIVFFFVFLFIIWNNCCIFAPSKIKNLVDYSYEENRFCQIVRFIDIGLADVVFIQECYR